MDKRYKLLRDVTRLLEEFELKASVSAYTRDVKGFQQWILHRELGEGVSPITEPEWEGKSAGRSPESVISTLLVHLGRYGKMYSKSAIQGSSFSTQEEFIYLINLKAHGAMTKIELIKRNIQEKPAGMQIINRLIRQGWVEQRDSEVDKRSKVILITESGRVALEKQMKKIRQATRIVSGDLGHGEKMKLISLLDKLDRFHQTIYHRNIGSSELLDAVADDYAFLQN